MAYPTVFLFFFQSEANVADRYTFAIRREGTGVHFLNSHRAQGKQKTLQNIFPKRVLPVDETPYFPRLVQYMLNVVFNVRITLSFRFNLNIYIYFAEGNRYKMLFKNPTK